MLIKSALQQPQGGEPGVEVVEPDGSRAVVPVSVGTLRVLQTVAAQLEQLVLRMDAIHHHLANPEKKARDNREACVVCTAQKQMIENAMRQAAEQAVAESLQQDANVVAGNVGAKAGVQEGTAEEEEDQVQE